MAGRHYSPPMVLANPRTRSPFLLFLLAVLFLPVIFYIVSLFSSPLSSSFPIHSSQSPFLNPNVDYSFVSSLAKFLTNTPAASDDTVSPATEDDVKKLDDLIWRREIQRLHEDSFPPAFSLRSAIRVYVYEMPAKFTYDMLWLFHNTYKDTSNLTSNGSPVHRLIEQHSIDYWLWADLIAPESKRLLKNVVRVHHQEDADLFYIPFFTTISFFLLEKQQCKALYRVKL